MRLLFVLCKTAPQRTEKKKHSLYVMFCFAAFKYIFLHIYINIYIHHIIKCVFHVF